MKNNNNDKKEPRCQRYNFCIKEDFSFVELKGRNKCLTWRLKCFKCCSNTTTL